MNDWSRELEAALHSGDAEHMQAALSRVPDNLLHAAQPYLRHMAEQCEQQGQGEAALGYREQLLRLEPDRPEHLAACARLLQGLGRLSEALQAARRLQTVEPAAGQALEQTILQAQAAAAAAEADTQTFKGVSQDLFDAPELPVDAEDFRVEGLRQLLRRYSGQHAPRHSLQRLKDPQWLAAWQPVLDELSGARPCFRGSELGVFALRALQAGAQHVRCVEDHPLQARIVQGMAQKHFLAHWPSPAELDARRIDAQPTDAEQATAARQAAFEQFSERFSIECAEHIAAGGGDCLVFPGIDHSLLGTGIVQAVREFAQGLPADQALRVLPASAQVFVMAIEWRYPQAPFALEALAPLRWSLYPQPLDADPALWSALSAPACAGRIDFADFHECNWELALPVLRAGRVDALLYWFELDLGAQTLSSAPDSSLRCLRPAIQHVRPVEVAIEHPLQVQIAVREQRLRLRLPFGSEAVRQPPLPSWFGPMLGDAQRNRAYADAIARELAVAPKARVLDIGAGCGLLSMLAARAGAEQVLGCERSPALAKIAGEIVAANGLAEQVQIVGKDCRQLKLPEDLPQRADLALFELFDCGLLGEGILHFLAYAREHLLAAHVRYLPRAARLFAQVVEYRFERVLGIDASLLNPYLASPGYSNVDAACLPYRPLCAPIEVFAFDFAQADPSPATRELSPVVIESGVASAVLFWFDLQLDEESQLSNAPGSTLHWKQALQFVAELEVDAGQTLSIEASHDGSALSFRWRQEAMSAARFSRVPRMDPRWLAASAELDQQTQNLLQHCAQHPEELAKVRELALRMAFLPAAHGLDPVIAQRFAHMLIASL